MPILYCNYQLSLDPIGIPDGVTWDLQKVLKSGGFVQQHVLVQVSSFSAVTTKSCSSWKCQRCTFSRTLVEKIMVVHVLFEQILGWRPAHIAVDGVQAITVHVMLGVVHLHVRIVIVGIP